MLYLWSNIEFPTIKSQIYGFIVKYANRHTTFFENIETLYFLSLSSYSTL